MKAKDLAEKLLKHPDAEVVVLSNNTLEINDNVSAKGTSVYHTGNLIEKTCTDAFDNGSSYKKKVWRFSGGSQKVIKING